MLLKCKSGWMKDKKKLIGFGILLIRFKVG